MPAFILTAVEGMPQAQRRRARISWEQSCHQSACRRAAFCESDSCRRIQKRCLFFSWEFPAQIGVDALFHIRGKGRCGADQLFLVDLQHHFSEHGKRSPAACFLPAQRSIVIEADAYCHGDTVEPIGGSHKKSVSVVVRRAGLTHYGDWEGPRIERVRRARRNAHDTTQAFLNQGQSKLGGVQFAAGLLVAINNFSTLAFDSINHMWVSEYAASHRAVSVCKFE
jgi:hypothetical protein